MVQWIKMHYDVTWITWDIDKDDREPYPEDDLWNKANNCALLENNPKCSKASIYGTQFCNQYLALAIGPHASYWASAYNVILVSHLFKHEPDYDMDKPKASNFPQQLLHLGDSLGQCMNPPGISI